MFRGSARLVGVAIAVIALLASGCNGGKGTQSSPGSPAPSSTATSGAAPTAGETVPSTPARSSTATSGAAPTAGETVPSEAALRSALLTPQEAGPAFRVANTDNPGPQPPSGVGGGIPEAAIALTSGGDSTGTVEALSETLFADSSFLLDHEYAELRDDVTKGRLTNDLQVQGTADFVAGGTTVRLHKQEHGVSFDGYDAITRVSPTVALLLIFRQGGGTAAAQAARDLFQKALRKASTTLPARG